MTTAYITIDRCGIEIEVEIDFIVTHYGSPSNMWDDPGEAPEWEPERISTVHAGIVLDINRDFSDAEYVTIDLAVQEAIADMVAYDWEDA